MAGLEIPAGQQEMLVDRSRALLRVGQKANLTLLLFPYARFFGGKNTPCLLPHVFFRRLTLSCTFFSYAIPFVRMSGHRTDFPEHYNSCTLLDFSSCLYHMILRFTMPLYAFACSYGVSFIVQRIVRASVRVNHISLIIFLSYLVLFTSTRVSSYTPNWAYIFNVFLGFLHFTRLSTSSNRHLKKNMGTGAEMCPAIVSGIITGDEPLYMSLTMHAAICTWRPRTLLRSLSLIEALRLMLPPADDAFRSPESIICWSLGPGCPSREGPMEIIETGDLN